MNKEPHRNFIISSHIVIGAAIVGVVVVALFAGPDVALVVGAPLAKMAEAAASTVRP